MAAPSGVRRAASRCGGPALGYGPAPAGRIRSPLHGAVRRARPGHGGHSARTPAAPPAARRAAPRKAGVPGAASTPASAPRTGAGAGRSRSRPLARGSSMARAAGPCSILRSMYSATCAPPSGWLSTYARTGPGACRARRLRSSVSGDGRRIASQQRAQRLDDAHAHQRRGEPGGGVSAPQGGADHGGDRTAVRIEHGPADRRPAQPQSVPAVRAERQLHRGGHRVGAVGRGVCHRGHTQHARLAPAVGRDAYVCTGLDPVPQGDRQRLHAEHIGRPVCTSARSSSGSAVTASTRQLRSPVPCRTSLSRPSTAS